MTYNTFQLSNGLRIIHRHSNSDIVYCGYQIAAGTRDEAPGDEGLAHFCEHATFKGTQRRSSLQIINALEGVGGELNAFTNKETTVYNAALQKQHIRKAVDVLTDIVFHSIYPQAELDKEVEVICDEIESYNDSPAELIYDDFENVIFQNHPLGHNILGEAERVRRFTSADASRFASTYYQPSNAIFYCDGDIDFKALVKALEKATADLPVTDKPLSQSNALLSDYYSSLMSSSLGLGHSASSTAPLGNTITTDKGTHQSHVMIGARAFDVHSPERMPLYLLSNMLGGPGMNARLNLSLRERNGLVYSVESTMVCYGDTGIWSTYFGCDPHDTKRCLRLVRKELDRLMNTPLSETRLNAAKRQIKGQIALASDNREGFALDFGKSYLLYGWEKDITDLYNRIDAITAEDMQRVACQIFSPDNLTTLIYS